MALDAAKRAVAANTVANCLAVSDLVNWVLMAVPALPPTPCCPRARALSAPACLAAANSVPWVPLVPGVPVLLPFVSIAAAYVLGVL